MTSEQGIENHVQISNCETSLQHSSKECDVQKEKIERNDNTKEKEHILFIEEPLKSSKTILKAISSKNRTRSKSESANGMAKAQCSVDFSNALDINDIDTINIKTSDEKFRKARKRGFSEPADVARYLAYKDECETKNLNSSTQNSGDSVSFFTSPEQNTFQSRSFPLLGLIHEPLTNSVSFRVRQWLQPMDTKINLKVFGSRKEMENEQLRLRKAGFVIHPTSKFR